MNPPPWLIWVFIAWAVVLFAAVAVFLGPMWGEMFDALAERLFTRRVHRKGER